MFIIFPHLKPKVNQLVMADCNINIEDGARGMAHHYPHDPDLGVLTIL